ncbi:hypothetical protein PRIPAC_83480 [Pristionchus pacificus]|uniref:Uncharacterized protein n=1 Tax=Pristionchus pacificus TaxID=54126 RepID=A0A2A6BVC6_PRIPA|nr:hypothetical protein PRIPAC_83480 [Pristionchus pacificus]|eukprot:PDM69859.1 hypothetical protein PRIPAC_49066 [Pristionchus pacificus]
MIVVDGMALNFASLFILMAIPLVSLSLIACAKLKKKNDRKQPPTAPPPKPKPQGTPIPRSTKPRTEPPASPQPTPAPQPPPPPPPKEETTAPDTTPAPSTTSLVPPSATPTQETPAPDEDFEETPAVTRNASSTAASPVLYDRDLCVDYTPDVIIQHEFLFQLLEKS